jgi:heme A synthase
MIFRELFRINGDVVDWVNLLARAGLVLFFAIFLSIAIWALTRRSRDVNRWSALALDEAESPKGQGKDQP